MNLLESLLLLRNDDPDPSIQCSLIDFLALRNPSKLLPLFIVSVRMGQAKAGNFNSENFDSAYRVH